MTQMVKNLPTIWETLVRSLVWEDPLEMGMATHSNILAWEILWTEKPGGLQSMGLQELDTTEQLKPPLLHMIKYYSATKMKELLTHARTWMDLKILMLNERSSTKSIYDFYM